MTEDSDRAPWGSGEDITALYGAIENYNIVDWPDEAWDGASTRLHSVLARVAEAVAPARPIYAYGRVQLTSQPAEVSAHIFTADTVVRISGEAIDPSIDIYPNRPTSISVLSARSGTHPRKPGQLEFVVRYEWGEATVSEKDRWPVGSATELLNALKTRIGRDSF